MKQVKRLGETVLDARSEARSINPRVSYRTSHLELAAKAAPGNNRLRRKVVSRRKWFRHTRRLEYGCTVCSTALMRDRA
eukprot:2690285-Pleurochrysis_carterae.AAC.5